PHQQPRLAQRVDFPALTPRAAISAIQRGVRHLDALSARIRLRSLAPVSGFLRTYLRRWFPRSWAVRDADLFQHRLRLLAARMAQQSAQTGQRRFPRRQQLGHVTQRAEGRFQLLIYGYVLAWQQSRESRLQH